MEQIPVFPDKSKEPVMQDLLLVLERSAPYWKSIEHFLDSEIENIQFQWKFYGKNSGWTLKVLSKKRNLFFVLPRNGFFCLAFVFGQKAFHDILASEFPDEIKKSLSEATAYAEGRGLHFEVREESDIEIFRKFLLIKLKY